MSSQTNPTPLPESSAFSRFMASGRGRLLRGAAGVAVITVGLAAVPWPAGLAVALVGVVPLATGAFNLCPIAPAWGGHFFGANYCARPAGRGRRES